MTDDRQVHIHVGDSVGQDKAGGDQTTVGDVDGHGVAIGRRSSAVVGDGGRRRMYEDEWLAALSHMQRELAQMNTEIALLKFQVSQLNDRLRSPSSGFGALQWWIVIIVASVATTAAMSMVWQVWP